jgi:hypothetical protein
LRLEHLGEEETDSVTPRGEAKHWHVWHINAARPEPGRITASWWRS